MDSIVCTLFEGMYHYGVAALVNSLHSKGFRGNIYAGYKGEIPNWAKNGYENPEIEWSDAFTLSVGNDVFLHFIALTTEYHLTNYKPNFMLEIIARSKKKPDAIFYYDPDIIQIANWDYMEEWVSCGVALCEDINSPLEKFHPKRNYWRKYFESFQLEFRNSIYVNGGFVGLDKNSFKFIENWRKIQEAMAPAIGGLSKSKLSGELISGKASTPYAPFSSSDQDALNATVEATSLIYSFLHKEAMGFVNGTHIMYHALGKYKPWNTNFLKRLILTGIGPDATAKAFLKNLAGPININQEFCFFKVNLKIASLFSRIYSKR